MGVDRADKPIRKAHAMRIMMYTSTVPVEAGGVQAVFHQVSDGLARRGHEVPRVWPIPFYDSPTPQREDYMPDLDGWPGVAGVDALRKSIWLIRRLLGGLRRHRPAIVNVHFVRPGCRHFFRWRRWFGYKVVLTFHGSDALCPMTQDEPYLQQILRRADAITAVSPMVAQRLREIMGAQGPEVETIYNGIDWDFWSRDAAVARPLESPTILAVGRLFEVKNHRLLVDAMAQVHRRRPDARLVILGGGHCMSDLRAQVARLGLDQVVDLPGQATPEEVRDWLGRSSVYVLPSLSEGMPLSLLEAMAAGVPCVATAVGGVPHVAGEGSEAQPPAIELVASNDTQALAHRILRLIEDRPTWLEMRDRGLARAQTFTLEKTINHYERLFLRLG